MQYELQLIDLVAERGHLLDDRLLRLSGVTPARWERLRRDDIWVPVVPGQWRHRATPLTWEMKVRAGTAWLGRHGALYGDTAGAWLGVEACPREPVAFLVPRAMRHRPPWLDLHTTIHWSKGDVITVNGVRATVMARAIVDIAATATPRHLEAVIDEAIRRRLTALPTLLRRSRELSGSGRPGCRLLRTLLLDSGGESYLERAFLRLMRVHGLPRPATQVVHRRDGVTPIRVDFEYAGQRVVVEVSGKLGHVTDRDRQRDARRRNALQAEGFDVIEFTTADVLEDPDYVVATVRHHLLSARAAHSPGRAMT